ncbi:MAG: two-component sensor histidine kinase [Thiohalocapsa sp.]|jgi:two-component system sensor histidine kinase PilS (NtrC family)|uniref:sensor histidine kinase n=1 Tax=Thiohalocapsa sp. TaxID=2497641 RepID=UPI0025E27206|nr:ATP-binding protein [Thiohalocapsa sp.]MCG6940792.1 two-component sensor histidine kinase [Thiohalocapsa sp.]
MTGNPAGIGHRQNRGDPTQRVFRADSALTWLFLYRLVLAALLALLFSYPEEQPWLGTEATTTPARILLALEGLSILVGGLMMGAARPMREQQIQLAIFLDIVVYTLLMHLAGGVASGLGLLPAIAVIAGAILMEGRLSLLFASLATLAVITQQVYSELYVGTQAGTYTQAGLLGLTYFAVALLAHVMTRRLRETERIAARRKLDIADLSRLNEYVIQRMAMGVVAIDGERRLLLLNNAARQLLGAPKAEPGDSLFLLAPALRDWFLRRLRDGGRGADEDELVQLGDSEVLPSLTLLGESRANGALIYLRDHRELLRQAQEMKLAALGRLTASIAHNIRNPLSSVTHAAQLLAESDTISEADANLLAILERNALRIDETVTSILELSRRHAAERTDINLATWLEGFADEYRDNHPDCADRLHVRTDVASLQLRIDTRHLGQILRNLCDNAFKHGARGGMPAQTVLRAGRDAQSGTTYLEVVDDGPGIPKENRRQVFEPFFTTSTSGTGLGLYIARELAEANGVRLEYIVQEPTEGRFRLTFGPVLMDSPEADTTA